MNFAAKALTLAGYLAAALASDAEVKPIVTHPETKESVERDLKQAGENCLTSVNVKCEMPDGRSCDVLFDISLEECGQTQLKYTYYWNNLNTDNAIQLFPGLTTPKLQNKELNGFDKTTMNPNEQRQRVEYRTVDTCQRGRSNASMKLEGWVAGFRDENGVVQDGYYCFAWKFLKVLIRQNTPVPVEGPPKLELDITCRYKTSSGTFNAPCSSLYTFVIFSEAHRLIEVEYTYTITNVDINKRPITLQGLISGGENLLPQRGGLIKLDYMQTYVLNKQYEIIDLSRPLGDDVITKKAIAIGTAGSALSPGTATDTMSYNLPDIPVSFGWAEPAILCYYKGLSCQDYINTYGCFHGEAVFHYRFQNTGFMCNTIKEVEGVFGSSAPRTFALDGDYTCDDRNICPNDIWTLKEHRVIHSCSVEDPTRIILQIMTATKTTTLTNTWGLVAPIKSPTRSPTDHPTHSPVRRPTTDHPTRSPTDHPTRSPTDAPQEPIKPPTNPSLIGTQCDGRPSKVWFRFTGEKCPSARRLKHNNRGSNKSNKSKNKHECVQVGDMVGKYSIIIKGKNSSATYVNSVVNVGDLILIEDEKLPTNTYVEVYAGDNNILVQTMTIHTSCSDTFEIGQKFGSVEAVGFETYEQGVVKMVP